MALPAYTTARLVENFGIPGVAKVVERRVGNYLLTPGIIAREALRQLELNLLRNDAVSAALVKPADGLQ